MKRFLFTIAISLFFLTSFTLPDDKTTVNSNLKTVTVYRNGAEMTHTATANLKSGNNELIIEGLSSYLDINSIQVNCPAAITILGVEFNNNFLGAENISPVVKDLKDSLELITLDVEKLNIQITTSEDLLEVLKANKEIKGTQTGLTVAELTKLMTYYKTKSIEVKNELITLNAKKVKLELITNRISEQIKTEEKKNTKSGGRLTLQLAVSVAGNNDFTISYITQNAFWTPYYDIKADNIKSPLNFIYKAKIIQTTGIDWKKVKLSLSTSSPKQFGNAPLFQKWFLSYFDPVNVMNKNLSLSNTIQTSLQGRVAGLNVEEKSTGYSKVSIRGKSSFANSNAPLYVVNGTIMNASDYSKINPNSIKSIDVLKDAQATAIYGSRAADGVTIITLKDGLDDYISVSDNELDISYDIDLPYDVPTNGKPQIAVLKETSVPATYKYYAVPKLDKDAFLLAEVANWQTLNLLPGEANIIFEGTYIGKSFIDPSNTSDTLNLTLGTDSRVVVKREKLTDFSSVKFLGSNKLQTITYEIIKKSPSIFC